MTPLESAIADYAAGRAVYDGLPASYFALSVDDKVRFLKKAAKMDKKNNQAGVPELLFGLAILFGVVVWMSQ